MTYGMYMRYKNCNYFFNKAVFMKKIELYYLNILFYK